jgi:peptidoglycan/xylan/chitin deacetylase (PgdA/CDA1 family)
MREFVQTDRILELHSLYSIPACFAVVGAAALPGARPYHDPVQVRRIHQEGHEVASHSFRHEWLPGLGQGDLHQTLRQSRDALEQCLGAPVVTFVPPWNQPRDYFARLAISVSERREAGERRVDLPRLCDALREVGYRLCRVAYQPLLLQLARRFAGEDTLAPRQPVQIRGVHCLRLNSGCGFGDSARQTLDRCVRHGGLAVVYAHPHSLDGDDSQNEVNLVPFLKHLAGLRDQGQVIVTLPRDLLADR